MSILATGALIDLGTTLIKTIWPNKVEQATQLRLLEELKQKGDLAILNAHVQAMAGQLSINKQEASHKSIFVAGWRPFVGWVGGVSLAYVGILEPIMRFIALMNGYDGAFPVIDTALTIQVLMGMLGLGVMRSFDKTKGTETNNVGNEVGQ